MPQPAPVSELVGKGQIPKSVSWRFFVAGAGFEESQLAASGATGRQEPLSNSNSVNNRFRPTTGYPSPSTPCLPDELAGQLVGQHYIEAGRTADQLQQAIDRIRATPLIFLFALVLFGYLFDLDGVLGVGTERGDDEYRVVP